MSIQRIGPYAVVHKLGQGAMGAVYLATDPRTNRRVAVKVMLDETLAALERFRREADAVTRLRHESIVPILDMGSDRGRPYLVMEYVEGETLKARIAHEGTIPARQAARWTLEIANGLTHAHEQQILHRDVKPENILVRSSDARALLTDFGLAKEISASRERLTLSGQMLGTPAFMPPEQATGELKRIGPRSDVYSLGATLYCMLTGEKPFSGASTINLVKQILTEEPRRPSAIHAVSRELESICLKCLAKEPDDRYGSARLLARDLQRFLSGRSVIANPRRRQLGLAISLLIALVSLLAGGAIVQKLRTDYAEVARLVEDKEPGKARERRPDVSVGEDQDASDAPPEAAPTVELVDRGGGKLLDPRTDVVFVYVPSGRFRMGSGPRWNMPEEQPVHTVTLTRGYFIGKSELTWGQYRTFCAATGRPVPSNVIQYGNQSEPFRASDDHPVFNVDWYDAQDYCAWAGYRLPTEAEWEFAARGPDGRPYPWGEQFPSDLRVANVADRSLRELNLDSGSDHFDYNTGDQAAYDDGYPFTAPVGEHKAVSWFKCFDMAGNVSELVQDCFGPYAAEKQVDPKGAPLNDRRVIRGGAWRHSFWAARSTSRLNVGDRASSTSMGFRVAYSKPEEQED